MSKPKTFSESVLNAFSKILDLISVDRLEHNFSPDLGTCFVEGVLGYERKDYDYERQRTDVTIKDENGFRAIVIETKRPRESLDAEKWREQAGKYADESTRFVGLTNGYRFLLWEVKDGVRELKADIDFKTLVENKKMSEEKLSTAEVEQILVLENLTKNEVWSENKYARFNEYYAKISVSDDAGFEKLVERLNYVVNDLLKQYTYDAFDEYRARYLEYKDKTKQVEDFENENGIKKNKKLAQQTAGFKLKLEGEFAKYASFNGYYIWKAYSNRDEHDEEENKKVFCKESIYVLLNRLLLIRILEDKERLKKRISNGGIEALREQLSEPLFKNPVYKQILRLSYEGAHAVYPHFYEKGNPLDWYESGDGELDRVLNKTLWILNQFNFSSVDRDVLGKLYEKYLPKDERKRLGEFYTPDEVVDYILDAVDYTPNKAIESKDLIDPACGSGGFLVRATRRLIARYAVKFDKATPKEALDPKKWKDVLDRLTPKECEEIVRGVAERIHGFDINPFAASITEMNLLFQVIDVYLKAAQANRSFTMPRFKVYRTDSLELPSGQKDLHAFAGAVGSAFVKERAVVDELKSKKYDFVVGNPPWLGVLKIPKQTVAAYSSFESAKGKFDIYALFIELGAKLLNEKGKLGYITQNRFLKADYAKPLRRYLKENIALKQLINFGDIKIFEDATNYPCIIIFENATKDAFYYVEFKKKSEELEVEKLLDLTRKSLQQESLDDEFLKIIKINQNSLADDSWAIGSKENNILFKKLGELETLADYSEKIMQGVTGGGKGSDDIFYVSNETAKTLGLETKLLKKVLRGKDIRKYYADASDELLIYPYDESGSPINLIMFPATAKYFNKFKEKLASRVLDGKNISKWGKEWFELWRQRERTAFEKQKILCPRISKTNRFTLDAGGAYLTDSAVAIVPKNISAELLLGLLNSKLLEACIRNTSPYVQGKYYNYSKTYIEKLPIKKPVTAKEKEVSEKIIDAVKEILKTKRKDNGADTKKLEDEVDRLVFELYGLTEEEKRVVEESLAN